MTVDQIYLNDPTHTPEQVAESSQRRLWRLCYHLEENGRSTAEYLRPTGHGTAERVRNPLHPTADFAAFFGAARFELRHPARPY